LKNSIGLVLCVGLAFLWAGCSSNAGNSSAPGVATDSAAENTSPNLDFAKECPGVHYEKLQGWTDTQILEQKKNIREGDIPACQKWIAAQPPGYTPPMPRAYVPGAAATAPYEGRGNPGAGPDAGPKPAQPPVP
jgi:hypothetical protein